ncbi:MAG: hypothetical protein ACLRJV_14720 [Eubacteriales bacterium]
MLLLSHLPLYGDPHLLVDQVKAQWNGEVRLAQTLMTVELPALKRRECALMEFQLVLVRHGYSLGNEKACSAGGATYRSQKGAPGTEGAAAGNPLP